MDQLDTGVGDSLALIGSELDSVIERVVRNDPKKLAAFAELIEKAPRVFVLGAGRSGLALRMTAMRLMHLGQDVHVVGEVTAPAIAAGDLLLTASGSGTTGGIVRAAQTAASVGARVAAMTTDPESSLAKLADVAIIIPAAGKLDRSGTASAQYAGGLFEQAVVLIGDALFDELWPRHANIE
jgi:6-phospho-3-hexuloisomerase